MCSPTHLNVVSGFQCDVKTHHRPQVLLSFRPYLLRELMNFSLARLLTSFKVPSSGLLHLLTPVAGVCSPERKQTEDSFACVVESEFQPPFRRQPIGAKEPFTPFLRMEWGVKLYCKPTDLTRNCFFRLWTAERHISGKSSISPQSSPYKKASWKWNLHFLESIFNRKYNFRTKIFINPFPHPTPQFPHKKRRWHP